MPLIRRHGSQRVHVMQPGENSNKPAKQRRPQTASRALGHHEGTRLAQHPNNQSAFAELGSQEAAWGTRGGGGGGSDDNVLSTPVSARYSAAPASSSAASSAGAPRRPRTAGGDAGGVSSRAGGGSFGSTFRGAPGTSASLANARASNIPRRADDTERLDGVRRVVSHRHAPAPGPREIYVTVHLMVEDASTGFCVEDADVAVFSRGNVQLGTAYSSDMGEAIFGLVFLGPEHITFSVARQGYVLQRKSVAISDNHDQTSLRVTVRLVPLEVSVWLRTRVTEVGSARPLRGVRLEVYRTLDSKQLSTLWTATGDAAAQLHLGGAETLTLAASKEGYLPAAKSVAVAADEHGQHVHCHVELQPSGINARVRVALRCASEQPGRPAHAANTLNAHLDGGAFRGTRVEVRRTDGALVALMAADEEGVAECAVRMLEPCFCEARVVGLDGFADARLAFEVGRHHDGQTVSLALSLRAIDAEVRLAAAQISRRRARTASGAAAGGGGGAGAEEVGAPRAFGAGGGGLDASAVGLSSFSGFEAGGAAAHVAGGGGGRLGGLVPSVQLAAAARGVAVGRCSQGGTAELLLQLRVNRRYLLRTSAPGHEAEVQELPIAWGDAARTVEVAVALGSAAREQRQLIVAVGREGASIGVIMVTEHTTLRQVRDILRAEQLDGTPGAYYFMNGGQKCGVATEARVRAVECFPTLVLQPRTAVHPYLVRCTPTEVQVGWEPAHGASEYMVDVYHEATKETYVGTFERWHMPERAGRRQECVFKFRGFQGLPLQPNQQFNFVVRPVLPGHSTKDDIVLTVRTREKAMLAVLRDDVIEVLQPVTFKLKGAAISAKSYPVLECVAEVMQLNTYLHVCVRGHANGGKGSKHQLAAEARLSLERAEAVLRHLVMLGVPKRRLKCEGCGAKEMLYPPSSSHAHLNRRIEFQLVRDQALVRAFHTG
eukprot:g1330.t1